jgi:hypothetical protein
MAAITSGTVTATPLGDFWIGTLELAPTADDGDTINLDSLISGKIKEVVFASGVRNATNSGSADVSPISWSTGTAKITLGNTGTQGGIDTGTIDSGRAALSNYRRDIFFVAKSQQ